MTASTGMRLQQVLIAAPALVIRQLSAALPQTVEVLGAATWEDAVQHLSGAAPDVVVVCYVFDELKPYRFIQHIRQSEPPRIPILLIRAITIPWGKTEELDVRRSYAELGVDAFLNFSDLANERGLETALQEFGREVLSLLAISRAGGIGDSGDRPA